MSENWRPFAKGTLFGAALAWVLLWVFPELSPSRGDASTVTHDDLPTLERIRRSGVARVGFANEAPFAFVDPETGRLTGEAPEIARVVLAQMGVPEVEGVLTEFGALIPGLLAGRFDLIAAGMYITPARCREVDFSNPTYRMAEGMIVRAGNPAGIHGYADVARNPDLVVGVVAGAIERRYALDAGIPIDRVVTLPDAPSALEAVSAGRIDAYAATSLTISNLLAKAADPRIERATPFEQPEVDGEPVYGYGAFAFHPDDDPLREAFDRRLAEFLGTQAHAALVAPFGFGPADLPGDATAAALCIGQ